MSSEVRASDIPTSHPRGFYFIFWGEFAERCSYYGMRAILFLYLTQALTFPDTEAGPIYMAFKMSCYFLPLLGGFLADRYFGKYWTIVGFSVPYVLGHFVLGISSHIALVIALALLAGGSGVIKPNISTLMGLTYDQLRPGQSALRTAAFQWFYFSINVGALLSTFGLPESATTWRIRISSRAMSTKRRRRQMEKASRHFTRPWMAFTRRSPRRKQTG